ncbi:malate dehydrogenase [Candidatus Woesearchaeota archaeon]|nr:malate dehydrogenase [Candidatus Woesearchaeota archaeon]
MSKRKKITIVGAGNVGASAAAWIAARNLGDVVLVDIVDGLPQGKALDLSQALPILGSEISITGTTDYAATKNSDIVVITAGKVRTESMTREDLLSDNSKIVGGVVRQAAAYSPDCALIIVSNPLNAMVHVAAEASGFPKHRVMGMAGCLDSARFKYFIAQAAGCSVEDVDAVVIGSHSEGMVPLVRLATVRGKALPEILSKEQMKDIVEKTQQGGKQVISFLKTSAYIAPGAAIMEMVEAIAADSKRVLPVSAFLHGEYGLQGLFAGVPAVLGANGMEKIIELPLTKEEHSAFLASCAEIQETVASWEKKKMN